MILTTTNYLRSIFIGLIFISFQGYATPPPIQLATQFRENIKVESYFVSEKLDGIRAYWDGQQLLSKQGNKFTAPAWFIASFPRQPLDGELWIKRHRFEQVSSIVRTQDYHNQQWQQVKFMIFDMPNNPSIFSKRIEDMQRLVAKIDSPYLKMIKQEKLKTSKALFTKLDQVVAEKGEGLMLHHQDALYKTQRNQYLMKLKKFEDAEATVIDHIPGKGKYKGQLGSLLVTNEEGITFKIGTGFSDQQRRTPPKIGAVITYRYTGKTQKNVPRFASFMRVRVIY